MEWRPLSHLGKGHKPSVPEGDDLIRVFLQLGLDEAEEVFLVHACAVVHVSVHLADVVEVAVGHALLNSKLAVRVEHLVQVEALLQHLHDVEQDVEQDARCRMWSRIWRRM